MSQIIRAKDVKIGNIYVLTENKQGSLENIKKDTEIVIFKDNYPMFSFSGVVITGQNKGDILEFTWMNLNCGQLRTI